jgi:hypothetical protein
MASRIRTLIDEEVRTGTHDLRASYLSNKYQLSSTAIQQVLSDLAAEGALERRYTLLCSGPNQNFDPDREYRDLRDIPHYPIRCSRCGDEYTPSEENVLVSFVPTGSYLDAVSHGQ